MDTPAGLKYTFPHRTLRELPPGMSEERAQPRLAAILATDVVGYSRMMGADELGTLAAVKAWHKDVVEPLMSKHNGRIVKLIGLSRSSPEPRAGAQSPCAEPATALWSPRR